jgi:hypothetical protein
MPPSDLSAYAAALTRGQGSVYGGLDLYGKPVPSVDQFRSPIDFGPGVPLVPRIDAQNYPPRESQYTPGWNLITTPRQEDGKTFSFAQLRAWADGAPQVGFCVRWIKAQILGRKWSIVPKEDSKNPKLKAEKAADIKRVTDFLKIPNRIDNVPFSSWVGQIMHEALTVDAVAIFKHRDRAGRLHSLVQVDGATIKPLIDSWSHVSGYQQILYGYPATAYGYKASDRIVLGEYPVNGLDSDLRYLITNPRVDNVYGTSPLEEILPEILVAVQQVQRQLAWYTEGTIPDFFIETPDGWAPDQVTAYFQLLRNELAGDVKNRMKGFPLPPGAKYIDAKPFSFTKDEHEAMTAFIYGHYGVPQTLARAATNRATADNQKADSIERSVVPLVAVLEEFLTEIINVDLDAPDLKFTMEDEGQGGLAKRDADRADVVAGILTIDEVRKERGLEELPEEEPAPVPPGLVPALPPPVPGEPVPPPQKALPEPAEDTPAAKAELAAWQKVALARLGRPSYQARAVGFKVSAIGGARAAVIQKTLAGATTEADVLAAFEKRGTKHLTVAAKEDAVKQMRHATHELFRHEYGRALEAGRRLLRDGVTAA